MLSRLTLGRSLLKPSNKNISPRCTRTFKKSYCVAKDRLPDVEVLRKKVKWRCMERGMKENELIFRSFMAVHLNNLNESELKELEALLDEIDPIIFKWFAGGEQPPERWQKSPIYNMVKKHVDENKVHRFSM